jgi:hypothetical protein
MLVGAVIGVAPLLAYNDLAFGSPLEQGYGIKTFATPIQTGLYGLLASPSRGLLVYTPYVIFSLFALLRAWRWPGEVAGRLRGLSLAWSSRCSLRCTQVVGRPRLRLRFLDDCAPVLFATRAGTPWRARIAARPRSSL